MLNTTTVHTLRTREQKNRRLSKGVHLVEFACAITFVLMLLVPLINLSTIVCRFSLAQSALSAAVHKLALSQKLSDALRNDNSTILQNSFVSFAGTPLTGVNAHLIIESPRDSTVVATAGGIEPKWLPDSVNGPCDYSLELTADLELAPIFPMPAIQVILPGLLSPLRCKIIQKAHWQNLSRDPLTRNFFINE